VSGRRSGGEEPVGAPVDLLLVAEPLASSPAASLFEPVATRVVTPAALRCSAPWEGTPFELLAGLGGDRTPLVGLLVPVVWTAVGPVPDVVIVTDHVNLTVRGPLAGRRPDGGPQVFPSVTGIYQPFAAATAVGGRVYSEVAVAGVADAGRLTPFERRHLADSGCAAVCDCLIDVVLVAAFHGHEVLACGIPQERAGH
jgi:hypothetical protein